MTMTPLPATRCPLCGGSNQCAPAAAGHFDVACWCQSTPISPAALRQVPADLVNKACLCPRCAAGITGPQEAGPPPQDQGRSEQGT